MLLTLFNDKLPFISTHDSINLLVVQNFVLKRIFFPRVAWVSFIKTREGELPYGMHSLNHMMRVLGTWFFHFLDYYS